MSVLFPDPYLSLLFPDDIIKIIYSFIEESDAYPTTKYFMFQYKPLWGGIQTILMKYSAMSEYFKFKVQQFLNGDITYINEFCYIAEWGNPLCEKLEDRDVDNLRKVLDTDYILVTENIDATRSASIDHY